ncbi:MAG: lycopene cyclase domain-containing protein [Candidatus Hodarchaeota archaeon]
MEEIEIHYFVFIILFVIIPIIILSLLHLIDANNKIQIPNELHSFPPLLVLLALIFIAVIWTTPWDNYLVAIGVWGYNPSLVTGLVIGWVPIEEYTFFVVQTVMSGLLLLLMAKHMSLPQESLKTNSSLRLGSFLVIVPIWIVSFIGVINIESLAAVAQGQGTYLSLIIFWLTQPIMLQLLFGADILWHYRRLVIPAILIPSIYLSAADILAIFAGTWHISLNFSTGIFLFGLPIEEAVFFFITNILIVFGMTLGLATESRKRIDQFLNRFFSSEKVQN